MSTAAIVRTRIYSIDLLKGVVMILMALDHTRDFFHYDASIGHDPLDFVNATPVLFLTRWITHFCAPVFVLLSGTSVFLYSSKGKTKKQVAFFLLTRGLWLMLAEIFLINTLWDFNIFLPVVMLQVIWAIGICMLCLSVLQFLPYKIILTAGLFIICGHNLLDNISVGQPEWLSVFWAIFHQFRVYQANSHFLFIVAYPFLPWLGLMMVGYCLGKLYLPTINAVYRRKFLLTCGVVSIMSFIILRFINSYGDMQSWTGQKTKIFTVLDFLNTTKYPPSLLYILMTIGPALVFLSFAEKISNRFTGKVVVFGKVPFFYYILHVFLIHALSWIFFFVSGHGWDDLDFTHFRESSLPAGAGYPLKTVYIVWIVVVILLYFPCRWYGRYKATHKNWWLSYL